MDKYLEDIQHGIFEAKSKKKSDHIADKNSNERYGYKNKPKKELKEIADQIWDDVVEGLVMDGVDWESEADRAMISDYELSDSDMEFIADILSSKANNLTDEEEY